MLHLIRTVPEFRRLFLAHTVSRAGDAFNTVALVVLVFELTGSGIGGTRNRVGKEQPSELRNGPDQVEHVPSFTRAASGS